MAKDTRRSRIGRPPKAASDQMRHCYMVRYTDAELETLEEMAGGRDHQKVRALLRRLSLKKRHPKVMITPKMTERVSTLSDIQDILIGMIRMTAGKLGPDAEEAFRPVINVATEQLKDLRSFFQSLDSGA